MRIALLIAFVLCASVSAQLITRVVIDDFGVGQGSQVSVTLTDEVTESDPDVLVSNSFDYGSGCSGLLGCARDMELRVVKGLDGRSFSSQILSPDDSRFAGNWVVANPKTSIGFVSIEYDGPDGEFDDLYSPDYTLSFDGSGSAGVDITDGGLGRELQFIVISDLATTFNIQMYDLNGGSCFYTLAITPVDIDYTDAETLYSVDLDSGSPNACDQTNIGYIQFYVTNSDAVDLIVRSITIIGDPDPSPSPTPSPTRTPTPAASNSRTPSPSATPSRSRSPAASVTPSTSILPSATPSSSRTPSRTPSPSGPCIIFCVCPEFTCRIAYDQDDNVNTLETGFSAYFVDDDEDSNQIVYIYVDDDANMDDDQVIYITNTIIQSFVSDLTSDLSVSLTNSFTGTFTASFSSIDTSLGFSVTGTSDDSSNTSDDDSSDTSDDDSSNTSDDDSSNTSDDDSSNTSDDSSSGFGLFGSSSSSASVIAVSIVVLAVTLF